MNEIAALPVVEKKFDAAYYRACYGHLLHDGIDPWSHYREVGWRLGLNPNPFFSVNLYLAANADVRELGADPFEHFMLSSAGNRPFASPLFDTAYYVASNPDVRPSEAIWHYWSRGRHQGRSPNALFDISHYRSQLGLSYKSDIDYVTHYLSVGWRQGLSPHPLFDPAYYVSQLPNGAIAVPPLLHYLEAGWRQMLSPHILFDPAYYAQNMDTVNSEPPLLHYLKKSNWQDTPHYLFSDSFYVAAVRRSALAGTAKDYRSGPPLVHYCKVGARQGISPHPLFNVPYYTAQAERIMRIGDDDRSELLSLESNALKHYCATGNGLGLSPTPLFDPEFYRSQIDDELVGDPLRHYLSHSSYDASPHPGVDVDYYASQKPDFSPHELPVILDLLMTPPEHRISPHPSFDPQFYLDRNPDLKNSGICPVQHFLEHGIKEARQPNRLFTYPYAHRLRQVGHPRFWNSVDAYFRAKGHERTRVLFLGHDASRSGAPLVLLALVQYLSALYDIECITVLAKGGPLVDDYVDASLTYVVDNQDREFLDWSRHSASFKAEMSAIADDLEDNPPALIICNSLESRHLADYFSSRDFGPLVTLVHEVADPYDPTQLSRLLAQSEQAIFVSKYQLGRMHKKLTLDDSKIEIVQFGALDDRFGTGDRAAAKRALQLELGLSPQSRIVLGCGTMNFRKGIDLFAEVACSVLSRIDEADDVHFVWVGGGDTWYDTAYYWAHRSVQDRGFEARVHFVGAKAQTEAYYLAADIFLLTSRADPFPCVIQEALACGLPIVAFEGKSGAAEAFEDSGISVPFDASAMAKATYSLLSDKAKWKKLRKRAKSVGASKRNLSSYAEEIFAHVGQFSQELRKKIEQGNAVRSRSQGDYPTVFIAMASWGYNEECLFAEHLVSMLLQANFKAELLFTRGPGVFNRNESIVRAPNVPFSFLYPKSQSVEHIHEELCRRLDASSGRTIFVPYADSACYEMLKALPKHAATVAILHGRDDDQLERVYALSRQLNHIFCTSQAALEVLLKSNMSLQKKISYLPVSAARNSQVSKSSIDVRNVREASDKIKIVCSAADDMEGALNSVGLVRHLREEGVPFELTVFADSVDVVAIRAVAFDLIRNGVLTLVECPAPSEMMNVLEDTDVVVTSSRAGEFGISVVQAMSVGCILILQQREESRLADPEENVSRYVVDGYDLRKTARIIAELQRDPVRLVAMSRATYKLFCKDLPDEAEMAAKFATAIAKLIDIAELEGETEGSPSGPLANESKMTRSNSLINLPPLKSNLNGHDQRRRAPLREGDVG